MTKHYGLTKKPNEGVSDNAPSWMDSLFSKNIGKTASTKKSSNPFNGVEDPFLNPSREGLNNDITTCEACGIKLKTTEIDICDKCQ